MATYVVGDLQGCYKPLVKGLKAINFNPTTDTLYCVGDLVNRGPRSGDVLRYLMDLGNCIKPVLGNHDISLLVAAENIKNAVASDTHRQIINAPDRDEMIQWLRYQPLLRYDQTLDAAIVHAGIHPTWSMAKAIEFNARIEKKLQTPKYHKYQKFLRRIFGNSPSTWQEATRPREQNRYIINVFTRMRYLTTDQMALDFDNKGSPDTNTNNQIAPWMTFGHPHLGNTRIFYGHWASMGLSLHPPFYGLDSGYVWGNALTFARIEAHHVDIAAQITAK